MSQQTHHRIHGERIPAARVKDAIQAHGGQVLVAEKIGISQASVSNYLNNGYGRYYRRLVQYIEQNVITPQRARSMAGVTGQINPLQPGSPQTPIPQQQQPTPQQQGAPTQPTPQPDTAQPARPVVQEKSDDAFDRAFPEDDAIKVIQLAENAHDNANISYDVGPRSLINWQNAYYLLADHGYSYEDALIGGYDLVIRSKTEPGSADRRFAQESFHTVLGLEAGTAKAPKGTPKGWHPSTALALPLLRAGLPVWAYGPKGSGKTYAGKQLAAALGVQSITVQATRDSTVEDFVGVMTAKDGATEPARGPVWEAMEEGKLLIVEEPSLADPAILMVLQQVLTGEPLTVTGLGETREIHAVDGFGIYCADNTAGLGEGVDYVGTQRLNDAFLDRFYFIEFGRMGADFYRYLLRQHRADLFKNQGWS